MRFGMGLGLGLGSRGVGGDQYVNPAIPALANVVRCWSTRRNIPAYLNSEALKEVRTSGGATPSAMFMNDGTILLTGAGAAYVAQLNSQIGSHAVSQETFESCPQIYDGTNMLTGMVFNNDALRNTADDAELRTCFANNFSMTAWLKFASPIETVTIIWQCLIESGTGNGFFRIGIINGVIRGYVGLTNYLDSTGAALSNNVWHLAAVTYDGANIAIYTDNGESRGSAAKARAGVAAGFIDIGQNNAGTGRFAGSINDIMLYSKALSQAEVQALYAAQKGYYGL